MSTLDMTFHKGTSTE